jgi:hypothetical protein
MKLSFFILIATATIAFGQASRPPVTTLSGLSDVNVSGQTDSQPLAWNASSSKWINDSTLTDIVISDSLGHAQSNFATSTISILGTPVFSFYDVMRVLAPFNDSTGNKSVDANGRQLIASDGATALADWSSGTNFKLPQLTTNGYVVTTGGNGTLSVSATAGTGGGITGPAISTTGAFPMWGNTSGNLLTDSRWVAVGSFLQTQDSQNSIGVGLTMQNVNGGNAAATQIMMTNNESSTTFSLYSGGYTPSGIINPGDLEVHGPGAGTPRNVVIDSTGRIRFSNDSGLTESFGITKAGFGGRVSLTSVLDQSATAETVHIAYTLPANSVAVGTVLRIHVSGNVDNPVTNTVTCTPRIRWGGLTGTLLLATPTFTSSATANTNRAYVLDGTVTILTVGASGTAVSEMRYTERSTSATGVETTHADNSGVTPVTIDTTTAKDLALTWQMAVISGTVHIRTISGTIEVVKP